MIAQALVAKIDFVQLIILAVVIISFVVNHLIGSLKGTDQRPKAGAGKPPQPPRNPNQPQAPEPVQQMRDEVEDFLRRAMSRQQGKAAPEPPSSRPPQRQSQQRKPKRQPSKAEIVPAEVVDSASKRRPALEEQLLSTSSFDQRAEQLTHLDDAESQFANQIDQSFHHQLGQFSAEKSVSSHASVAQAALSTDSLASKVAMMLRDPASIQQAILLSEIMQPRGKQL